MPLKRKVPFPTELPFLLRALPMLIAVLLSATGCDGGPLFEKTNPDPHPPQIRDFTSSPESITTGDTIKGTFTYFDAGADIEILEMRDLSGTNSVDPTPPPPPEEEVPPPEGEDGEDGEVVLPPEVFFFPGTSGTIEWQAVIESNQAGSHTIKAFLEDSKGSRSNEVRFTVKVFPPGIL